MGPWLPEVWRCRAEVHLTKSSTTMATGPREVRRTPVLSKSLIRASATATSREAMAWAVLLEMAPARHRYPEASQHHLAMDPVPPQLDIAALLVLKPAVTAALHPLPATTGDLPRLKTIMALTRKISKASSSMRTTVVLSTEQTRVNPLQNRLVLLLLSAATLATKVWHLRICMTLAALTSALATVVRNNTTTTAVRAVATNISRTKTNSGPRKAVAAPTQDTRRTSRQRMAGVASERNDNNNDRRQRAYAHLPKSTNSSLHWGRLLFKD